MIAKKILDIPSTLYFEILAISLMLASLTIQSRIEAISAWNDLPFLSFVRALIWLFGLLTLPGLYIVRLLRISSRLSRVSTLAVAVNLSFVFVSLITLVFYKSDFGFSNLPLTFLIIIVLMGFVSWYRSKNKTRSIPIEVKSWSAALLATVTFVVVIAFFVQLNMRYLIPGDNWVSLKPAVTVIDQRSIFESFADLHYPPMFGFTLSGLAVSGGFPLVNMYVILFPLVGLSILSFYALLETVFDLDRKRNALACGLFALCGGLGGLIQVLFFGGAQSFWTVSQVSQDMYFSVFFWSTIQFSYKSLAITLAFTSLAVYAAGTRLAEDVKNRVSMILICALLLLFSFFVHMLEIIIFVPIILGIVYLRKKGTGRLLDVGLLLLIGACIFAVVDVLMGGFYSTLFSTKALLFISSLDFTKIVFYSLAIVGLSAVVLLARHFFAKKSSPGESFFVRVGRMKTLIVRLLLVLYVAGLFVWSSFPVYDLSAGFPWYRFVTRYGIVGGFAILGVGVVSLREKRFLLAMLWSAVVIGVGSVWWGERTNGYLFPMVVLFATFSICSIWEKTKGKDIGRTIGSAGSKLRRFSVGLKNPAALFFVALVAISTTSTVYGAYYYASVDHVMDDDLAKTFSWIAKETDPNCTIIVPNTYDIRKGVNTISDRRILNTAVLPASIDPSSFENLTQILSSYNAEYIVTTDVISSQGSLLLNSLVSFSKLVFQSGEYKVFKIPSLRPLSGMTVATFDWEFLGLRNKEEIGWYDDSFQNWTFQNCELESDGELLTYTWQFEAGNKGEPSARITDLRVDTNKYPYFFVKYRNTEQTVNAAKDNVCQIVTPYNEMGQPAGSVENIYLPVDLKSGSNTVRQRLPENQNITSIVVWMRNSKNLTGNVQLEIDYMGFAKNESLILSQTQGRFLSMFLPALWQIDYSIVDSIEEINNVTVVISQFDQGVFQDVLDSSNANAFIFVNSSANVPSWGVDWKVISSGIVSGLFSDKKVVVVASSAIQSDLSTVSELVYSVVFDA